MTSAPVKDVGSLMNYVGGKTTVKTGGTTKAGSFGDVMSKTQSGSLGTRSQTAAGKETGASPKTETVSTPREPVKTQETSQKPADIRQADETAEGMTREQGIPEKQGKALEEAGKKILKEIAEEFQVSEEEVEAAMEILGLSVYALFDPSSLRELVLQLEGAQDTTVLLTDETLFGKLQNVLGTAAEIKAELGSELELTPEELQTFTEALQAKPVETEKEEEIPGNEVEVPGETVGNQEEKETAEVPQITVEVKKGDETVKLSTDAKGNVTGASEVVSSEAETEATRDHAGEHEQKGNENGREQSEDTARMDGVQLNASAQNRVETPQVSFEQTTQVFSQQTREIMDQIMDYMRIQLKPGMDQLEMQLHPESLGTVHIQLSSKGGEVTAQFQVQNETVKAAIESQIVSLQETLKEQGVKVEAVQVTVESHGFESNLWQGQGREENPSSHNGNRRTPRRINLNELEGIPGEEAGEEELLAAKMMRANGNTVDYTA